MPALVINSIEIPVALDEWRELSPIEIGTRSRSNSGSALTSMRAMKRAWQGTTPPLAMATFEAYRGLILGLGFSFSFSTLYSDKKGLWPDAGHDGTSEASGKFGNRLSVATSGDITYGTDLGSTWTVALWKYSGAAWVHYVVNSAGSKWENGVAGSPTTTFLSVSSGDVTLTETTGSGAMLFDDMVCVPYLWPATWPAIVVARGSAYPSLPELECSGDLLPDTTTCVGSVADAPHIQASGAVYRRLTFTLEEI